MWPAQKWAFSENETMQWFSFGTQCPPNATLPSSVPWMFSMKKLLLVVADPPGTPQRSVPDTNDEPLYFACMSSEIAANPRSFGLVTGSQAASYTRLPPVETPVR